MSRMTFTIETVDDEKDTRNIFHILHEIITRLQNAGYGFKFVITPRHDVDEADKARIKNERIMRIVDEVIAKVNDPARVMPAITDQQIETRDKWRHS